MNYYLFLLFASRFPHDVLMSITLSFVISCFFSREIQAYPDQLGVMGSSDPEVWKG